MGELVNKPGLLFRRKHINLYYAHELYKNIAQEVSHQLLQDHGLKIPITSGMWGGSYLIAEADGTARSNVIRLYSINSLPQNSALDEKSNLQILMDLYQKKFKEAFQPHGIDLVNPQWGETVPYTNATKPNVVMQLWDRSQRVSFVRSFFVWNEATWEESIIYDTVRNIKQIKEYLDTNHRPIIREAQEFKFVLQDVLIIYYALKPALTPDFIEHAEPLISKLLDHFLTGLHDEEQIQELFFRVFDNYLVYGYEEAIEGAYQKDNLDIRHIEDWPVEKINWVPAELKEKLIPMIQEIFLKFKTSLGKQKEYVV